MRTHARPVDSLASTLAMSIETRADDPLIGEVLASKYKILSRLGSGNLGTVYKAVRSYLFDEVAVKVLHPHLTKDPVLVERFHREACAAAKLHDPRIVKIYDYWDQHEEGLVFLVMELIEGQTLSNLLKAEGPLPVRRAVDLMIEICGGVAVAHQANIVHRDLKPDNIMLSATREGRCGEAVVVFDFGVCKLSNAFFKQVLTEPGMIIGTPYYMAPEQCRSQSPDARADVYSLGATLYEMLSGRPPFEGETLVDVIVKQIYENPEPLTTRCGISTELNEVIMRALSKDPLDHQADAMVLLQELQECKTLLNKTPKARWQNLSLRTCLMSYL